MTLQEAKSPEDQSEVWERQQGEPARWYARFEVYRLLGTTRSVRETYQIVAQIEGLQGKQPSSAWYQMARKWNWQQRAEAWDADEREKLRAQEKDRRFDAREQRLRIINHLIAMASTVLRQVDPEGMSSEEARAALPTIRALFKDLLGAHRAELGLSPADADSGRMEVRMTADDLLQAQAALEKWQQAREGD